LDRALALHESNSAVKDYRTDCHGLRMGLIFPFPAGGIPLSEITIVGPPLAKTTKRLDKPPGTMNWHHRRPLRTLKDILSEQSRVYRAMINGVISTTEGTRLVFVLKEIRCTREAVDAAEAAAKAAADAAAIAAQTAAETSPMTVTVVTIPEGHYLQPDGSFAPMPEVMRLAPAVEAPPEPQTEAQLLAELEGLTNEQLRERAIRCGLDPSLLSSSSSTNND